jgi:hypothetical protein
MVRRRCEKQVQACLDELADALQLPLSQRAVLHRAMVAAHFPDKGVALRLTHADAGSVSSTPET